MKKGYNNWAFVPKYKIQRKDYSTLKIKLEYPKHKIEIKKKKTVIDIGYLKRLELEKNLEQIIKLTKISGIFNKV